MKRKFQFEDHHYKETIVCNLQAITLNQSKVLPHLNLYHQTLPKNCFPSIISQTNPKLLYKIVLSNQIITIYKLYPSLSRYEFYFTILPINLHIIQNYVYILLNTNLLYITKLDQVGFKLQNVQNLQGASHIYCMTSANQSRNLKIFYWKNGFKVYQHSTNNNYINKLLRSIKQYFSTPYQRVIIIQSDILAIVINSAKELRFLNLKNGYILEPGSLSLSHLNLDQLQIKFLFSIPIDHYTQGSINGLLCLYQRNSQTQIVFYKICLSNIYQNKQVMHTIQITKYCSVVAPGMIQSILLCTKGFYVSVKQNVNSIIIKTFFYDYNQLLEYVYQLENLDIWIQKNDRQDKLNNNLSRLPLRMIEPDRYPYNFINNVIQIDKLFQGKYKNLFKEEWLQILKNLKCAWYRKFNFQQMIQFEGNFYVMRNLAVSMINIYPKPIFDFYYQNFVKNHCLNQNISFNFHIPSNISQQLFSYIINHFHKITSYGTHRQKMLDNVQIHMKLNLLMGKVRYYLKVIAQLLIKLKKEQYQQFTEQINTIIKINEWNHAPIMLKYQSIKQLNLLYIDRITICTIKAKQYLIDANFQNIMGFIFQNLFKSRLSRRIGSQSNKFIQFLVQKLDELQSQKIFMDSSYIVLAQGIQLNQNYLRLCLLTDQYQIFRSNIIKLLFNFPQKSKQLFNILSIVPVQFQNKQQYIRGRAILQYLGLINQQFGLSRNNILSLTTQNYNIFLRKYYYKKEDMANFNQLLQYNHEILNNRLDKFKKLNKKKVLEEFEECFINGINYYQSILEQQTYINSAYELSCINCYFFNFLIKILSIFIDSQISLPKAYILEFIQKIIQKLTEIAQNSKDFPPINFNNIKIYDKTVSIDLLYIIKAAQKRYKGNHFLRAQLVLKYAINQFLESPCQNIFNFILKHYSENNIFNTLGQNNIIINQLPQPTKSILLSNTCIRQLNEIFIQNHLMTSGRKTVSPFYLLLENE